MNVYDGIFYEYIPPNGINHNITFIHGFGLDHRSWDPQVEYFKNKGYGTLRYDLRGFGSSKIPDQPYSHVDDLKNLLNHLNIEKTHIVGLSKGGEISLNFAVNYPGYTFSLILADSALSGYRWNEFGNLIKKVWKSGNINKSKELWLKSGLFDITLKTKYADLVLSMLDNYSGWHWINRDLEEQSIIAINNLAKIDIPALIIIGEHDLSDFHNISILLYNKIKGSKLKPIPNAGHISNLDAPQQFNTILNEFIENNVN